MQNNIFFNIDDNGIAELVFDFKKETNIFDYNIILELEELLKSISRNPNIKVLILKSNKKDFVKGYDLDEIRKIEYFDDARNLSKKVKDVLNKLSNLRFTTISIINGDCLSIGIEILLSTDYRIVVDNSNLQFYENFFKITPIGGANIILPRIIGLENSINYLLGQKIELAKALELKLINKIVSSYHVNEFSYKIALEYSNKGKYISDNNYSFKDIVIKETKLGKKYILNKFNKSENNKFIDFIINSYGLPLENSLEEDSNFFAELCESNKVKNIIDLYFSEKNIIKKNHNTIVEHIGIFNIDKLDKTLYKNILTKDINIRFFDDYKKINHIFKDLNNLLDKKYLINNISYSDKFEISKKLDLILLDDINLLDKIDTNKPIIINNTDYMEIPKKYKYPNSVFFISINNNLVEIIANEFAEDESINKIISFFNTLNKKTIILSRPYTKNLLKNYLQEALVLYEENYNPKEIDTIIEAFGFIKGPFKIIEENENIRKELGINNISYNKKDYREIRNTDIIKYRLLYSIIKYSIEYLEKISINDYTILDIASVYGFSFPIKMGGIFKYIDDITIEELINNFEYLNKKYQNNFPIPNLLLDMDKNKTKFYK